MSEKTVPNEEQNLAFVKDEIPAEAPVKDETVVDTPITDESPETAPEKDEQSSEDEQKDAKPKGKRRERPKKELTPEEKAEKEKKAKDKPKDIKKAAKRLISYITVHKRRLIIVALCVIFSTAISTIAAVLMQPVYDTLEQVVVKESIDQHSAMAVIIRYVVLMAIANLLSATMAIIYTKLMLHVTVDTVRTLRRELFNHLQYLPVGYFDKHKTGEIMSRFTSDVGRINDLVNDSFPTIISSTIQAVMTLAIMIYYSWKITLTLTFAVVLMVFVVITITNLCSPLFKKHQKAMAECNAYMEEYIRGIKAVKVFCFENRSKERFSELNENYRKIGVKANIIGGFMGPIVSMIARVNYAISVSLGVGLVLKGKMTVANLIVYLSYASGYGGPVISIAGCYSALISALAGAERIFEVLDTPFEEDGGNVTLAKVVEGIMGYEENEENGILAWKVPQEDGSVRYVPVKCDVDIKDLTFAYEEGKNVIKHVTTHADSGKKLAFVGSTGAGKTTITNLINRFYETEEGEITIDGINIKDIKKADLRSSMAFVLQDARLFAGTIAENIRYGKLDATDEEVEAAARLANAHSFIEKLPEGYETSLRADGVNLSQGEGQLLNIARAAISGRPLLVLDEATSSVDTRTERQIEKGMDQLMQGKTVLVIAHRLSTVRNSQNIVVLENGEIIEHGDHQSLIDFGGKYYQLYTGMFEMT